MTTRQANRVNNKGNISFLVYYSKTAHLFYIYGFEKDFIRVEKVSFGVTVQ